MSLTFKRNSVSVVDSGYNIAVLLNKFLWKLVLIWVAGNAWWEFSSCWLPVTVWNYFFLFILALLISSPIVTLVQSSLKEKFNSQRRGVVAETNWLLPPKSDLRGSLRSCHSRCSSLSIKNSHSRYVHLWFIALQSWLKYLQGLVEWICGMKLSLDS